MGLTALSLERSKATPLHLRIEDSPFGQEFHDIIAPHIRKTETLEFEGHITIRDVTQMLPNFPRSTPNLRSLELIQTDDEPRWDPSVDPFVPFPQTMRSLKLCDIPLYPSFFELRTLTKLTLQYYLIRTPLDTILDFLEENHALESVDLVINVGESPIHIPQRRPAAKNQLSHLSIMCWNAVVARTLISGIPLRRGAHLGLTLSVEDVEFGLSDVLSGLSITHLSNLPSPTFMEYCSRPRKIQLTGPNGSFSYSHRMHPGTPFKELTVLSLTNIREICLTRDDDPPAVFHPSSFPALETLTFQRNADVSPLFSALFPDPSFFPSLKTLKFLDCVTTGEFMGELTHFASHRKDTASAWLNRVAIIRQDGSFPNVTSIRRLEEHVPIVDVQLADIPPCSS